MHNKMVESIIKMNMILDKFSNLSNIVNNIPEFKYQKLINQILSNEILYNNLNNNYLNIFVNKSNDLNNYNIICYLNIISKINENTLNNVYSYIKNKDELNNVVIDRELKPVESAISQYIGYAYRKDSKTTIDEAFDKSIIKEIDIEANEMFSLIKAISDKRKDLFNDRDAILDLVFNIRNIVENETTFSIIISHFFKAIYEGTNNGNKNIIYEIAANTNNKDIKYVMDIIKHIRSYYQHSSKKTNKKYKDEFIEYIQCKLHKDYAIKSKDWVKLQLELYKDINNMLFNVYNALN